MGADHVKKDLTLHGLCPSLCRVYNIKEGVLHRVVDKVKVVVCTENCKTKLTLHGVADKGKY